MVSVMSGQIAGYPVGRNGQKNQISTMVLLKISKEAGAVGQVAKNSLCRSVVPWNGAPSFMIERAVNF